MATTLNFDAPKSSTQREVEVTGLVDAYSYGYLTIRLNVTNPDDSDRDRSFYRVVEFDNTGSSTPLEVNDSYTLSIVPKLSGADTVTAVAAWSYTPNE
ncbi:MULTISPECIES: hypothetical protein [Clostridium]|jgi:hypothetical protein|uniref:Uncharacterized protein n=2 Tax=Clostridium TaxID=1485 RepID=A0A151ARA9_9CLOT|nr:MULTISPECIES: hypothetical protein [Clostridium]KYH30181.1 hypothetical protein CLCOL_01190 [Clostridium colicanis DSM 13634]MBE6044589.1 hypothetical protein [Clostridium thermopalmarium]PRR76678.1 hypothetical protein CPAL_00630 [Clostridium thermopalmarium DSM 5974]PVZ23013.1 hypothetical protein LX19_01667 [Clostridium thermopalmarium DSM 5974]